jgi:Ca2+/H+ antiporter
MSKNFLGGVELSKKHSMEIGSAYALQVCLLQIPAMVAFSAWYDPTQMGKVADTFTCVISYLFKI